MRNDRKEYNQGKRKREFDIKKFIVQHSRTILPIVLIVCVAVTVLLALLLGKKDQQGSDFKDSVSQGSSENEPGQITVTDEGLKNNAYPEVNELIMEYYGAVASGDVDKILTLSNNVDDTEKIRIKELSKYLDSYPSVEIYTKPGPMENSYLAYVNYQVKFKDYESTAPGIQTFLICTGEDGSLYMNEGSVDESVTDYIQKINMQEDVVELFNRVAVEYNELLVNNPDLGVFLQELNSQMDISVGEALAENEAEKQGQSGETDVSDEEQTDEKETQETEPAVTGPVKARANTTVNVRSSDSETADKLGKVDGGTVLEVLEMRPNGWSKVMYEGKEAFIKSEYLDVSEDASKAEVVGTVKALDNVNIRSSASETGDKLGVIYQGEELELIEKLDNGWSKVKYKDQVAYVKSEFVE